MIENGPVVIGTETISIGASETGYSDSFDLIDTSVFALEYKIACTGTPNIKLELQQSSDNTNWYLPDTLADIASSVTDKNQHGCQLPPITVRYLRIKATEQTTTVDDNVITLKLSAQKRFAA